MEYKFSLRDLCEHDATKEYLSWFEDEEVKANISWQPDSDFDTAVSQLIDYIKTSKKNPSSHLIGIFHNSVHIGNIGFSRINSKLGYALAGILIGNKNYRGRGLASTCLMHSCLLLNSLYKVDHFELRAYKWNNRAIKAYKKAGFTCIPKGQLVDQHEDGQVMSLDIKNLKKKNLENKIIQQGKQINVEFIAMKSEK